MKAQVSGMGGWWWRFTDYVIDDTPVSQGQWPITHRYIRPAPDARLEPYQVLIGSDLDLVEGQTVPALDHYQTLLNLNVDDDAAIVSWCRQYGLLGILPQTSIQLRLAPRWRIIQLSAGGGTRRALSPCQTIYVRTPAGWQGFIESTGWDHMMWEGNEESDDTLAEPNAGISPITPKALMTGLFSSTYEEMRLGEAIGPFFPQIPMAERDTTEYPHPLSDEFWNQYCEPLAEFRWAVKDFQTMIDNLSHAGPMFEVPPRQWNAMVQGRDQLNSLLSISPGFDYQVDGTTSATWTFPSLLAIFAFEIWEKLIGGQSVKHCKRTNCRRLFLTAQYNRDYCSDRCRQSEEKARQRRSN